MAGARELTIGEAAACLAVDFPGVTAAVLRRLESAGKFTAARTGAGYRRYSDSDLDLIRIVLSSGGGADPSDLSGAESPLSHPAAGLTSQGAGTVGPGAGSVRQKPESGLQEAARAPKELPGATQDGVQGGAGAAQRPSGARTTARAARTAGSRVPAARGSGPGRAQAPAIAALFDVPPGGGNGAAPAPGGASRPGQVPAAAAGSTARSSYAQTQTQTQTQAQPQSAAVPSQLSAVTAARARRAARYAEVSQHTDSVSVQHDAAAGIYAPSEPAGPAITSAPTVRSSVGDPSSSSTSAAPPTSTGPTSTFPAATTAATAPVPSARPAPAPATPSPSPSTRRADRRWPDTEFFTPDLGEVSLDLDQLASAARTDRAWVDGLVEYGVLPSSESAGGADLLVARASAELAQFGVEPRHLRAVAASAARVAELIAVATATGTARDPSRRERAALAASGRSAEAAAAAVRLHAALVRAALLRG